MIIASHLTKKFPGRIAVSDLSFEVAPCEVVGFLGPNGSGKSTTMRIIAGYLAPSGGFARVAGIDVTRNPVEARQRIGYLPENCPLYPEMRVDEYLRFRATLKKVPRTRLLSRIAEVKELCGLGDSGRRIIGQLSRGYRQRVGLADAIVHDPELLVLDEPTTGLDPNQIRHVRDMIRKLGRRHAILFSTHNLAEVEAVCRRVVIIQGGRMLASGDTAKLMSQAGVASRIVMEIKAPQDVLELELRSLPAISSHDLSRQGEWISAVLYIQGSDDMRPALFQMAASRGWVLRDLHAEEARLEDLFVRLTTHRPGGAG